MSEPVKPLTGQRLLASLRGLDRPVVIVDADSRIVFANDAASSAMDSEDKSSARGDEPWARRLFGEAGIVPASVDLVPAPQLLDRSTASAWLTLPLRGGRGSELTLCVAVEPVDPLFSRSADSERWEIDAAVRHYLSSAQDDRFNLKRMLQLAGGSAATTIAHERAILAVDGRVNTLLIGETGVGKKQLAEAIVAAWGRKAGTELAAVAVSSHLVDRGLLRELLTLAVERAPAAKAGRSTGGPLLVLEAIDRWPADCIDPLDEFLQQHPQCRIVSTASRGDLATHHAGSDRWNGLATRLSTLTIELPPISERATELPILLEMLLKRATQKTPGCRVRSIGDDALRMLLVYRWPGNLAELKTVVGHLVAGVTSATIQANDLPLAIRSYPSTVVRSQPPAEIDLEAELQRVERSLIENALAAFPRNRAAAARLLGLSRTKLLRRIESLGIDTQIDTPLAEDSSESVADRTPAVRFDPPDDDQPVFEEIDEGST